METQQEVAACCCGGISTELLFFHRDVIIKRKLSVAHRTGTGSDRLMDEHDWRARPPTHLPVLPPGKGGG